MILGLYKNIETTQGFEGGFWRVTNVSLEIGDINNLTAICTIKCFKDYNFANTHPNGYLQRIVMSTETLENKENNLFHTYFEGSNDPIEVQNSYYNFFKNEHPLFSDAIIIDTDIPETLRYLGENPNIVIPQNLQS